MVTERRKGDKTTTPAPANPATTPMPWDDTPAHDFELRRGVMDAYVYSPPGVPFPQRIKYHSPTGYEWGYGGSGPADLALNILARYLPTDPGSRLSYTDAAYVLHQDFKWSFVAVVDREAGGTIRDADIRAWLRIHAPAVLQAIQAETEARSGE